MDDISQLEECYKKYSKNLSYWLPEGLIDVNLELLLQFGLLNEEEDSYLHDPALTRYFHVVESNEKITLVNDQFIIWITPERIHEVSVTYVLIALNKGDHPELELGITTSGVYNTSRLVLRVLEKFLIEIQENEEYLSRLNEAS